MKALRTATLAVLDKLDQLLSTEPARLIGYGAAAVVFVTAQFFASRGYVRFDGLTFEDSVGLTLTVIALLVAVVESIRRFVYSPQTYIEDLADEYFNGNLAGHDAAHTEEFEQRLMAVVKEARQQRRAEQAEQEQQLSGVPVGTVDNGKPN